MNLLSLQFVLFLAVALCAYYGVGHLLGRGQWLVLLVVSFCFYGISSGWKLLIFIVVLAAITWVAAAIFDRLNVQSKLAQKQASNRDERKAIKARFARKKRVVLWTGLLLGLAILGYFKYWNTILHYIGRVETPWSLGILLPLGISFYTFQSLGYMLDVYDDKIAAEKNFLHYLLFVSWFPQLILGPINRYDEMAPQLFELHLPDARSMERGFIRAGYGTLKKFAIANTIGGAVKAILGSAGPSIPGSLAVLGIVYYSIQDYADFSGGIDMVEGVSELFGIEMAQNFRQPYFASSLADFWRRWHMSLGEWMRSHVFYPLALTRPLQALGKWARKHLPDRLGRTLVAAISNVVVFVLVGLWHGAELHYIAWGLHNGLIIAFADLLGPFFSSLNERFHINAQSLGWRIFASLRTFVVVNSTRFFGYIGSVSMALFTMRNIFTNFMPVPIEQALSERKVWYISTWGFAPVAIIGCVVVFVVSLFYERGTDVREHILSWRFAARAALYIAAAFLIIASFNFDTVEGGTFIYANF